MSGKDRLPFTFHVKGAQWVPDGSAPPAAGRRVGSRDAQLPIEAELHASPELDRLVRDAQHAHRAERAQAAAGARRRVARDRMAALGQPGQTSSNLSQPAEALYGNLRPQQPGSGGS